MKITAFVRPGIYDRPTVRTPREFDAVDEFADALREAGADVRVVEERQNVPMDGFVLLFDEQSLNKLNSLGPRLILVNADRSTLMVKAESNKLACAVEKHRYFMWRAQRSEERGDGVVGRREVLAKLPGASAEQGPYSSANYSWMTSDAYPDLPRLMVAYLSEYAKTMRGAIP
jgi:hypothetical protein